MTKNQEKNKGGRPKKALEQQRNRVVSVRFTEQEHAELSIKSAAAGYPSNGLFLRDAAAGSMSSRPRKKDVTKANQALYVQLTRVSNNINQLAKAANSGLLPSDLSPLAELQDVLQELRAEILK